MADESDKEHGMSELGRQFIAGQLAHMRELSLLFAPNINSYKRLCARILCSNCYPLGTR
jgi:glutamine synthetase